MLMTGARLVILDEPTSVLAPQEVEALFGVVDHLRQQDFGILIVTHKLNEVRAIADRVTVLRGGRTILATSIPATTPTASSSRPWSGAASPTCAPADREQRSRTREPALSTRRTSTPPATAATTR